MQDRRVARGSTYAAMVIPAGTNPEAMMSKQSGGTTSTQDFKKKSFKKTTSTHVSHPHMIMCALESGDTPERDLPE